MRERLAFRIGGGMLAPARAREVIGAAAARRFGPDFLELLQLLISEVVTNSVRHGDAHEHDCIDLDVVLSPEQVRVEVADRGNGFESPRPAAARRGPGGWGLVLVAELAERWGIDHSDGTRVWFEVVPRAPAMATP